MRKTILIKVFFFLFFFNLESAYAKISNKIVVNVGNQIITDLDIENEIKTMLILNREDLNQKNIDKVKNLAVNSLVERSIKKNEIIKYKVEDYSENDLIRYLTQTSKKLNTDREGLKKIFENNLISYDVFVNKFKTELLWNTLIYSLYKNQININIVEIENELKKSVEKQKESFEYELSEIEILKKQENLKKNLDEIYKTIKDESFESAVKKYSISSSTEINGRIGWFDEKSLSKIYFEELKKTKEGGITNPIQNGESLVILKINNIKNKKNSDIDLVKLKKQIVNRKKDEKLNLFSRSHYSNVEASILVKFK